MRRPWRVLSDTFEEGRGVGICKFARRFNTSFFLVGATALRLVRCMSIKNIWVNVVAAGLVTSMSVLPAVAELPSLTEKESLGYFTILKTKEYQFGLTSQGKASIKMLGKTGEVLTLKQTNISVDFFVEETWPSGKVSQKVIVPETLESLQPATDKPKDIVFRAKTKDGIAFEVFFTEDRGAVSLGGRLLPSDVPNKNPLRFVVRARIPAAYPDAKDLTDKKVAKAFEQKISKDRLTLILADGKRTKLSTADPIDAGTKEINGPGITAAQLELSPFLGKKVELKATENSAMTLSNTTPGPLHDGFAISWSADAAKDPQGKARLLIDLK